MLKFRVTLSQKLGSGIGKKFHFFPNIFTNTRSECCLMMKTQTEHQISRNKFIATRFDITSFSSNVLIMEAGFCRDLATTYDVTET